MLLNWDTTVCDGTNPDHHITFGLKTDFPASPGGTYGTEGGVCNIGTSGSFLWLGVPDPAILDPLNRMLWFIVQTNNAGPLEGPWGADSFGNERDGPGPNGASNQCGLDKDVRSNCP